MTNSVGADLAVRNERRDYQRVQEAIGLEIELLLDMPAAGEGPAPKRSALDRKQVRKNNKYDIAGYGEVKRDYPDVANYIASLEERIRTLLLSGDEPSENPTHKVSLSASGMAFADDLLLQPGDVVSLKLTLFPEILRIGCDATVISVGDAQEVGSGDKHTYRVVFTRLADEDKTRINEHVLRLRRRLPNEGE